MADASMNRKEFLAGIGRACACSCVCALAANLASLNAGESTKQTAEKGKDTPVKKPRSQERMEFAEEWVVRFFRVLDENLDEQTRKKIMMANGRACFLAWQKETNRKPGAQAVTLERFAQQVKEKGSRDYQMEGKVIFFQYNASAETGLPSSKNRCLCPMVETNPAGLSPTFCMCSLGYVKEMHEQMFKKPVNVELMSSVLHGDPRCRFRITVS
jgi:hypothetical protein